MHERRGLVSARNPGGLKVAGPLPFFSSGERWQQKQRVPVRLSDNWRQNAIQGTESKEVEGLKHSMLT